MRLMMVNGDLLVIHEDGIYPLVNIQKAIENGHRNSGYDPLKAW